VLEREEIYSRLWGYTMVRGDRSVDVFVRKLRQKLEKASPRWRYIHTHFGIGYRFAAESLDLERYGGALPDALAVSWGADAREGDSGDEREVARAQQERELAAKAV
jgi:Transcriptional regulatory protein, C terminal